MIPIIPELGFSVIWVKAEELAYLLEKELIAFHGRKDLKLGPLFNYGDGGRTDSGKKLTGRLSFADKIILIWQLVRVNLTSKYRMSISDSN